MVDISESEYSKLVEAAAKWEAVLALWNGEEVSDFMLSFPEVRAVADALKEREAMVPTVERLEYDDG